MKQIRPFDQSKAGSKPLYCLRNTRLGYSIAPLYDTAIEAWRNTEQHKDRNIPAGLDVPLYYTYKKDGHINVRLANGKVWSDGDIYSSLEAFEAAKAPVYLGWGESVNKVKVIEGGDMSTVGEIEFNNLYIAFFGPMEINQPTDNDRKRWVGAETNTVVRQMQSEPRHAAWLGYIEDLKKAAQAGGPAPAPPTALKLSKGLYEVT